jgi:transposase-like protein
MKTFEIQLSYRDRSEAKVESSVKVDASSLPGAVAKATRDFVKSLDRKQRFDMNKNGLEITAKSAGASAEGQSEAAAV